MLESNASNVLPTPREKDPSTQQACAADGSTSSPYAQAPANDGALAGADTNNDSKTTKEPGEHARGGAHEEAAEEALARERPRKRHDDDSDDIARATDQETLKKLSLDA